MNKTAKTIFKIGIALLIIAILILCSFLLRRLEEIPENPVDTAGNTAGNLYNGGLFYENDGVIYFANPYDNNYLYRMETGQSNLSRVSSSAASLLNGAGDFLYYYTETGSGNAGLGYLRGGRGIYRINIENGNSVCLVRATTDSMILAGNYLYYTDFAEEENGSDNALITVNQIKTDGSETKSLLEEHIKLGSYSGGYLYYAGMANDHYLYSFDPLQNRTNLVCEENMYLPIFSGGYIYYLDLQDDYHLKRYSLNDGSITTLVATRIDTYNLYNSIIYYQTCDADNYELRRIYVDGTGEELVMQGVYNNISITSEYVYFTEFGNQLPVYQTSTFGAVNVTTFDAARDAAFAEQTD